jgi:uncharacterized protein YjdB
VLPRNATNKAVTFSVVDGKVATVDESGFVKGITAGKVQVVVTTVDGGFKGEATVTVIEKPPCPEWQ